MNKLQQLKLVTTVVADTGEIEQIKLYHPQDATTNPSLILKAVQKPEYKHLVQEAMEWGAKKGIDRSSETYFTINRLLVNFGSEILKIIPGRISTEADARLSFNTDETVNESRQIIDFYKQKGIERDRVLIKIASTWEGIQAGKILEKEGIHCNMTLLFNYHQAIACAQAGVTLVSPFVGRIYDWYKKYESREYSGKEDPGVQSVNRIYNYYRHLDIPTVVMGASFRNVGQIEELAGCDLLTISPSLMNDLQQDNSTLKRCLSVESAKNQNVEPISVNEKYFRWHLNEDAMATEKLAEGIRSFSNDLNKLEGIIEDISSLA
jgi:transaldolase